MAGFPNFSSTPVQNLVGVVQNPVANQNPDGTIGNVALGRQGDTLVSDVHGTYYNVASRGNVFFASSGLAGSVVKLSAATMTSVTFSLLNPVGSGVNVELIDMSWQQFGSGTEIVTQLGVAIQTDIASAGVPTTLTAGVINNGLVGGGNVSKCVFYTVATMTNAAIGAKFPHFWLFQNPLATTVTQAPNLYEFKGKLIMPPGSMLVPVAALTGTEIEAAISLSWAEHLV